MGKTKIEWCEETWNPIAGCSDVSEGCRHCYARGMAGRLEAMGNAKYAGLTVLQGSHRVWTGKIAFDEKALRAPLRKKKPTMYFANSMSDLFHPGVTDEEVDRIFAVMALSPQHTFQVLTKRPERLRAYLQQVSEERDMQRWLQHVDAFASVMKWTDWPEPEWPLPNVWLGVSVEDQKTAAARIPLLLQTPAAVRFVSAEPLLGPVDMGWSLTHDLTQTKHTVFVDEEWWYDNPRWICENGHLSQMVLKSEALGRDACLQCHGKLSGYKERIDWAIVGGESGPGARPMHPAWARSLRDQCKAAEVPFFFKQWGEWAEVPRQWVTETLSPQMVQLSDIFLAPNGEHDTLGKDLRSAYEATGSPMRHVGKRAAGHLLDGVAHREFPAVTA